MELLASCLISECCCLLRGVIARRQVSIYKEFLAECFRMSESCFEFMHDMTCEDWWVAGVILLSAANPDSC